MQRLLMILSLIGLLGLGLGGDAVAELLAREHFNSVTPETFSAYPNWAWEDRDYDFGPFSVSGFFDTVAYYMPIAAPVELPAIGGDNLVITLDPPSESIGFDFGAANFGESYIVFFGDDGGVEIELASFAITDLMDPFSGPSGYQGFVGFRDDVGRDITRVTVGPIDLYLDNVYLGQDTVANENSTWSSLKSLYR